MTIDSKRIREIERFRRREKRKAFAEHLKLGLRTYKKGEKPVSPLLERRK